MTIFGLLDLALTVEGARIEVSSEGNFSIMRSNSRGEIEYLECNDDSLKAACGSRCWSMLLPLEEKYINKAHELLNEKIRSGCWRSRSGNGM